MIFYRFLEFTTKSLYSPENELYRSFCISLLSFILYAHFGTYAHIISVFHQKWNCSKVRNTSIKKNREITCPISIVNDICSKFILHIMHKEGEIKGKIPSEATV